MVAGGRHAARHQRRSVRIQDLIANGKSLAEVKAAGVTRDYDRRYGAASGPWTTERFIETIYREIAKRP